MTEQQGEIALPPPPAFSWWDRLRQNPIVVKELRSRMRGGRAFMILSLYLLFLSGGVSLVFLLFFASDAGIDTVTIRQSLGKAVFAVVVSMQLLTMCFIAPALTAGSIASEREQLTFDLLRTTLLPGNAIVYGKLVTALFFLYLLLFTALPLQSLALLFGGIDPVEILISVLILLVTALGYASLGIFFSSLTRRSLVATVLTYAITLLLVFGIPIFLLVSIGMLESLAPRLLDQSSPVAQSVLFLLAWLMVSANPLATAIVTEIILIEEQTAIIYSIPLGGGGTFPFLSPWIGYTVMYLLFSLILLRLAVRLVRRPDR